MPRYTISQQTTGVVLFSGEANSEADALDKMARDAGYDDYASIPTEIGGGDTLLVEPVRRRKSQMTDDNWPKRADGSNKSVGEMTKDEARQVFRDAGKRLEAEFNRPAVKAQLARILRQGGGSA